MSNKELLLLSPTNITITKSHEDISVTLSVELSEPADIEIALALLADIQKNLTYPHPDFPPQPAQYPAQHSAAAPTSLYPLDLPQNIRHELSAQAIKEGCSINTLVVHWLTRLCASNFREDSA